MAKLGLYPVGNFFCFASVLFLMCPGFSATPFAFVCFSLLCILSKESEGRAGGRKEKREGKLSSYYVQSTTLSDREIDARKTGGRPSSLLSDVYQLMGKKVQRMGLPPTVVWATLPQEDLVDCWSGEGCPSLRHRQFPFPPCSTGKMEPVS